jgi:3-hydroxyisobutyrate dehydrogenase-like beta-hydroxyacid dehydrogenase
MALDLTQVERSPQSVTALAASAWPQPAGSRNVRARDSRETCMQHVTASTAKEATGGPDPGLSAKPASEHPLSKGTTRIGFLGLGLMGSRLVRRLHSQGWNVQAWNRSPEATVAIKADGIRIAEYVTGLAAESDLIVSCLANDTAVNAVYCDRAGVLSAVRPGTIVIEMSTISPRLSTLLHREAACKRVRLLDVAISGSTPAVEAGTVTLLAGGDRATFDECVPVFESIARQWFLIGGPTSGVQMKLVVNLLIGLGMQAIAEAISLGEHLQIDRNVLLDVLSETAAVAPAMVGKFQKIKNHDYTPQFPLRLMSKDMDLVMEAASLAGASLPAAGVAQLLLASARGSIGDLDLSAITQYITHREMAQL